MKQKINVAQLLKDCPQGMELDCLMFENVYFDKVSDDKKAYYPILCYITDEKGNRSSISFTKNGCESIRYGAKCVIFPKGKTTWEGFIPPCQFKDGDVLISAHGKPFILKKIHNNKTCESYCGIRQNGEFVVESHNWTSNYNLHLATEEEKQKLFDAIKEHGYKWNHKTKTLEKLPKFKVDNKIKLKGGDEIGYVTQVTDCYFTIKCKNNTHCWPIERQDAWELVPNKFDINTLKPFKSEVLVRNSDIESWCPAIFGCKRSTFTLHKYVTMTEKYYTQCIPYKGNEHLLGTTEDCNEFYKTWK